MRTILLLPLALTLMGAAEAPSAPAEPTAVVALEPLAVGISDSGRIDGRLQATLAVRGMDADLLTRRLPVLRSAALSELNEFARLHATPWAPVDAAALAEALSAAAKRAVPEAESVLILQVAARPA